MAAGRKELVGQNTLYGYLKTTSNASTSGAATSKSDDASADGTSSDAGSSGSSNSCEVEPDRKRLRKATASHHRIRGIPQEWMSEYQWLKKVRVGKRIGMICKLCQKHAVLPRSGSKIWTGEPCMQLRLDKVKQHAKSKMHGIAIFAEADTTSRIHQALSDICSAEIKAAVGCCKCVYWLCKHEIEHTTTYPHLLELAQSLGCDYFKALNVGHNATDTSSQIVGEFLEVSDGMVIEEVLQDMLKSSSFSITVDESTDISVLKQLVIYGRAMKAGKLITHYLKIVDIDDGNYLRCNNLLPAIFRA